MATLRVCTVPCRLFAKEMHIVELDSALAEIKHEARERHIEEGSRRILLSRALPVCHRLPTAARTPTPEKAPYFCICPMLSETNLLIQFFAQIFET